VLTSWRPGLRCLSILALGLGILVPSAVSAHAVFVSAQPAPGEKLVRPPASVRIVFSEPLNGPLSGIEVFDSSSRKAVPTGARVDPADGRAYVLGLPLLSADRYTVLWHDVSAVDGHAYQGSYAFTVLRPDGSEPAVKAATTASPGRLEVPGWANAAAKWLALLGLFLLSGPVLLKILVTLRDPEGTAAVQRVLAALFAAGIAVLLVGSAAQLVAAGLQAGGLGALGYVLQSSFGVWWLVRGGAAVLLALGAWLPTPHLRSRRFDGVLSGLLVVLAALSFAATSHGAASDLPVWGAAFDLVHLLATSVWIGGIIALGAVMRSPASTPENRQYRGLVLRRFSIAAGMAVPAVLISGIGSALIELGSLRDLIATDYGVSLTAKIVLVAGLLLVAAANALVLRPAFQSKRPGGKRLVRTVALEAVLGIAVLVPAAVMTVQVPSRSQDLLQVVGSRLATNDNPARQFTGSTQVGDQDAELTITPAEVGINHLRIELQGLVGIPQVLVTLQSPNGDPAEATLVRTGTERQEDGSLNTVYETNSRLTGSPGAWRGTVTLPGGSGPSTPLFATISPASAVEGDAQSRAQLAGWLITLALALAGFVAIAAARGFGRRRHQIAAGLLGAATFYAALVAGVAVASGGLPRPAGLPTSTGAGSGARADWGRSASVAPRTLGSGISSWTIPTPIAGLMTPAIGPDGSVWISEMTTNKLARLLPKNNRIQELDFGTSQKNTMGVGVDATNIVWLAQGSTSAIGRFDPGTGDYREFPTPTPKSSPAGIAIDSSGIVWFTELGADKIGRFDPTSESFQEFALPSRGVTPYWLAVAPDGRIWFTELSGARVGVLNPASGQIVEYPTPNDHRPSGIAVDQSGLVWVGTLQGSVIRFGADPSQPAEFRSPGGLIYGVAIAADGTVWAGTTGSSVYALNPASGEFDAHALPAGSGPWWPVATPDGGVWVALGTQAGNALVLLAGPSP